MDKETTYKSHIICHNCHWRVEMDIPKGTRVDDYKEVPKVCLHCGCSPR